MRGKTSLRMQHYESFLIGRFHFVMGRGESQKELVTTLVEDVREVGYVGERLYSGWFPNLYLESIFSINADEHPSAVWSPVVVDVHTDSVDAFCTGDPGGVLHQGVGLSLIHI